MLDAKFVLDNKDFVLRKIASRGIAINLDEFSRLSEEKKQVLRKVEELRF
jgi:seryl-tRNA synthetase